MDEYRWSNRYFWQYQCRIISVGTSNYHWLLCPGGEQQRDGDCPWRTDHEESKLVCNFEIDTQFIKGNVMNLQLLSNKLKYNILSIEMYVFHCRIIYYWFFSLRTKKCVNIHIKVLLYQLSRIRLSNLPTRMVENGIGCL